jgi:hypothetical protein
MMERDRALSEAVEAGRAWTSTLSAPAPQVGNCSCWLLCVVVVVEEAGGADAG